MAGAQSTDAKLKNEKRTQKNVKKERGIDPRPFLQDGLCGLTTIDGVDRAVNNRCLIT